MPLFTVDHPDAPRAFQSGRAWVVLLATLIIGLAVDLGSKSWSFRHVAARPVVLDRAALIAHPSLDPVPPHSGMEILPGVLQFRLVINRGAVFGLGANQRGFFIVFTLIALFGGLYVFRRMTAEDAHLAHMAVGLVLGGGIGNLWDRIAFGVVRDFIRMFPGTNLPLGWTWPGRNPELFPWVFNVADALLLSGMILLMLYLSQRRREQARREVSGETHSPDYA